jgi:hypothetical protein
VRSGLFSFSFVDLWLPSLRLVKVFPKSRLFFTDDATASVENENDQQELRNCMNEAAFSNCNAENYINIDKDVQTEPNTMDIDMLVQNF